MTDATLPTDQAIFSIRDVCRICCVSRSKLYLEMQAGRLSAVKMGKKRLIHRSEIQRWLGDLPKA